MNRILLQNGKKDAELIKTLPWTELQLAYTKLEPIRRYMYGNKYSEEELDKVMKIRQKKMNCEYTRRCREKLTQMIEERKKLVKIKEDLLKEISELKDETNIQ